MTRKPRCLAVAVWLLSAIATMAQEPSLASLGPQVGEVAPAFTARDQFGREQTLQSLMDRNGLMLVFFRSADW